jgi:nickel-dependent lactate racemase
MEKYQLAFGKSHIDITLPAAGRINVVEGRPTPPVTDVPAAVRAALAAPIGTHSFKQVFVAGDKVTIVASDLTRGWLRHDQFLPVLLDELNTAGVSDEDITLVVALGAHRRHTPAENAAVYGEDVARRIRIEQSYAEDEADFVHLGTTSRGVPVNINRHVMAADKVLLTGGIVYHPMAGFAGGRKGIIPGVSSYATIQANHRYCLAPTVGDGISPTAGCGSTDGNPMHEDQMEIAAMVNPAFLFNVILSPDGGFARFVAGHWQRAWEAGCRLVAEIYGVPIGEKADLVIASAGGYPKDMNFYQASKATENALAACKEDGVLIAFLECPDIEDPADFSGWFDITSLYERELALRQRFTVPGYVALKVGLEARRTPHIIVTLPENKAFFAKVGMTAVTTFAEALALAEQKLGRSGYSVTILPHAANTAPLLAAT